jgi:hypothetical protein
MDPVLQELRQMNSPSPADLIRQETDLLQAGLTLQQQGLQLLLAEMCALAAVMPGNPSTDPAQTGAGQHPGTSTDAEIEASFDNMPV